MFDDGEKQIDRILVLVERCPEPLKLKCFEVLLAAYANSISRPTREPAAAREETGAKAVPIPEAPEMPSLPPDVLARFKNMAKRSDIDVEDLLGFFDITGDTFKLHAYKVPGAGKGTKTRNVALLVAAKSYLATGTWSADWKEVKSEAVNQSAYDMNNYTFALKKSEGDVFKTVESGKNIELTSAGVAAAEKLLKSLVVDGDDNADK